MKATFPKTAKKKAPPSYTTTSYLIKTKHRMKFELDEPVIMTITETYDNFVEVLARIEEMRVDGNFSGLEVTKTTTEKLELKGPAPF